VKILQKQQKTEKKKKQAPIHFLNLTC